MRIEGVDFVKGDTCYEIGLDADTNTGFYTPFWPQNASYTIREDGVRVYNIENAKVFKLDREISSDMGTDVGGLKAMLLARGDHWANYTDISEGNYDAISQSVLMNIQAEFDQLIHNVATKVNSILAKAAGVQTGSLTLTDGTVLQNVSYCEVESNGYLRGEDGSPMQLFSKVTTDGYRKVTALDENGAAKEYWVYNEEDPTKGDTLYSIRNLQINPELMQSPGKLGFRLEDGSDDLETTNALKEAFTEESYTLNPNVKKKTTFVDYYTDLVSQIANSGSVYRKIQENQECTVESTQSTREQVIGVSSDEELSNMIKFQNAYNASSRYINVIDQMLEHIINTLGV